MYIFILIFIYITNIKISIAQQSFQNYDPNGLTQLTPPIIGSHLPYQTFDQKNLPTVPIIQNGTNLTKQTPSNPPQIKIETIKPEQIEEINQKPTTNIKPSNYHKPNIEETNPQTTPNNTIEQNNNSNLTIIGSEGAIPEPIKIIEPEIITPPIETQKEIKISPTPIIRNTKKISTQKKEIKIYTMTEQQKKGKEENLPEPELKINENIGWKRQIMPPNIAQKIYNSSNK